MEEGEYEEINYLPDWMVVWLASLVTLNGFLILMVELKVLMLACAWHWKQLLPSLHFLTVTLLLGWYHSSSSSSVVHHVEVSGKYRRVHDVEPLVSVRAPLVAQKWRIAFGMGNPIHDDLHDEVILFGMVMIMNLTIEGHLAHLLRLVTVLRQVRPIFDGNSHCYHHWPLVESYWRMAVKCFAACLYLPIHSFLAYGPTSILAKRTNM